MRIAHAKRKAVNVTETVMNAESIMLCQNIKDPFIVNGKKDYQNCLRKKYNKTKFRAPVSESARFYELLTSINF